MLKVYKETMTMKTRALLSTALLLATFGLTSVTTQAEEATTTAEPNATESTAEATEAVAEATTESTPETTAQKTDDAPKVSPQVQKLMLLHPQLISRIQPFGRVCFEGEECDINITVMAAAIEGQARDGKTIYDGLCQTCHAAGLAGAPKFGDKGAWAARLGKGTDTLYHNAINGIGAMPPKGGGDISDEEVHNAVDYMIKAVS